MKKIKAKPIRSEVIILWGDDGNNKHRRVLRPNGVLIFKWSEVQIPAAQVWKTIGQKPLFGHHSGKNSKTFWGCFMKGEK